MIIATTSKIKDWDKHIGELAFALRTAVNSTTLFTPAFLNFFRELRTPFDNELDLPTQQITRWPWGKIRYSNAKKKKRKKKKKKKRKKEKKKKKLNKPEWPRNHDHLQ